MRRPHPPTGFPRAAGPAPFLRSAALAVALLAVALTIGHAGPARAQPVDLALVLAVDGSFSVDNAEFGQQAEGLAAAFADPEVVAAIRAGPIGAIAVTVLQWSSAEDQVQAIGWTRVDGPETAGALARTLAGMPRLAPRGGTAISAALTAAAALLDGVPWPAERRVIDVSGDGRSNTGPELWRARKAVLAAGVTINGLAIGNEDGSLPYYFEHALIGGPGAFVEVADDYAAYGRAIRRKLLREIEHPASAALPPARVTAASGR